MCGKKAAAPPPVVQRDPVAEQREAEARAQTEANSEMANKRRRRATSGGMVAQARALAAAREGGNGPSLMAQATPGG